MTVITMEQSTFTHSSYIHGLFSSRQSSNENNHNIIHFHLEMLVSRCYHEDGIVKIGSMFVLNVEALCQ